MKENLSQQDLLSVLKDVYRGVQNFSPIYKRVYEILTDESKILDETWLQKLWQSTQSLSHAGQVKNHLEENEYKKELETYIDEFEKKEKQQADEVLEAELFQNE